MQGCVARLEPRMPHFYLAKGPDPSPEIIWPLSEMRLISFSADIVRS